MIGCIDRSLGRFIFNNYRQALEKIELEEPQLSVLCQQLNISTDDLEHYLQEERSYLNGLHAEDPHLTETSEYMEVLLKLDTAK